MLAAGFSTRFVIEGGQPKLAMPYGSSTVVGTVVASAVASNVDGVVVVTGAHRDVVEAALPDSLPTAHNDRPDRGNLSSLIVGLDAVSHAEAVIVLVGDMPDVDPGVIDRMLDRWEETGALVCLPTYTNGSGHPILIDQRLFDRVRRLTGPRPLWSLIESLDDVSVQRMEVDVPAPLDLNTNEEYLKAVQAQEQAQDQTQG